ncbi:TnsA endonuclease-like protein [Panacagrimonas perspica]|uniref:TnsA endonuclease-like protein n=1 Tax=Panacagrimonas perspica TaxID=381431 RepID=A0A4R7NR64_9GAMM|nr:TnsA endonuclease N-terminal domain-containing protein [Panacagrimonas perspica]TDU23288.1 TnsA endonuclease-like protein [Panacagrimonas perspica]THD02513.1 hypothetical protein B1810_14420 [Panacagrimonas perspica]
MRTTKRFTPATLDRFRRQGRGQGVFGEFSSWHQVTRGDPSSRGRSHITFLDKRGRDTLSDLEWTLIFFALLINPLDLRTQYPLELRKSKHELCRYRSDWSANSFPGFLDLAEELKIRTAKVHGEGKSEDWVPSTDLLLTLGTLPNTLSLLAISGKYQSDTTSKRKRELLGLERDYWIRRRVEWLLITETLYSGRVALMLRNSFGWAIDTPVTKEERELAASIALGLAGRSRTYIINSIAESVGDNELAQRLFWQSIWFGPLCIDLDTSWHPYLPVRFVTKEEFIRFNPIASRRSAWS